MVTTFLADWLFSFNLVLYLSNSVRMFVVERVARGHSYLYLVESIREGKTIRQRTIKPLGRKKMCWPQPARPRQAGPVNRAARRTLGDPLRYRCRPALEEQRWSATRPTRYLKSRGTAFGSDPGKLAEEARFDGVSVLRTNARVTPAAGRDPLPRPARGRIPVPRRQGQLRYKADLSPARRAALVPR